VEKQSRFPAVWINTGKIWAFDQIAMVAGKGEVSTIIRSAVLLRDNMLDVIGEIGLPFLGHSAILTAVARLFFD